MTKSNLFTNKISVVCLALAVSMLWGTLFPMIKIGYGAFAINTESVPSILLFAGLRFFVSGLVLTMALCARERRLPALKKGFFKATVTVSMLTVVLHYVFTYVGLSLIDSSKSSVLKQIGFLVLPCLVFLVRKDDRFSLRRVLAAMLGFTAVLVINLDGMSFVFGAGELLIVAASFTSAIGQVVSKHVYDVHSPSAVVAFGQLLGGGVMLASALAFSGSFGRVDAASIGVLAYICVASITANLLWNTLIKYNDMSSLAVLKSADPLFASAFSGLWLSENVFRSHYVIALCLVVSAIALSNVPRKSRGDGAHGA